MSRWNLHPLRFVALIRGRDWRLAGGAPAFPSALAIEDFEQEIVDQYGLAMAAERMAALVKINGRLPRVDRC